MTGIRGISTAILLLLTLPVCAQPGNDPAVLLKKAFDDLGEKTVWQLSFHGSAESGEPLKLYLAYSESYYMAYLVNDQGELHYFEGKYDPEDLQWVCYQEDIIQGYLIGTRRDGVLSGEWMNRDRSAGQQVYFVQDGSEYADRIPLSGAVYCLNGSLNGRDARIMMDWQSDGRIRTDLYEKGGLVPTRFYRDEHFPSGDEWTFNPESGKEKLVIQSPILHTNPTARLEKDRTTIEYGRFQLRHRLVRRTEPAKGQADVKIEWVFSGKNNLDKRIQEWVTQWLAGLPGQHVETMVWFEATGAAEDLLFGRWWTDRTGQPTLVFRGAVIDLKSDRILDMAEWIDIGRIPGRESEEDALILDAGQLCWEGPQHRIIGRTRHCTPLKRHLDAVVKKFSGRMKNTP